MLAFISILVISYLIGSIPGGYISGKGWGGVDVREHGSGNIGTTNVLRVLGKGPALVAFLIDLGKGIAAVWIAGIIPAQFDSTIIRAVAGLVCICGHNWSFLLKFRGGKGVATSAGVFLILTPLPFVMALLTMAGTVGITRYVSLGSMVSASTLPLYIWVLTGRDSLSYVLLAIIVAGLVIARHFSNLKRLLAGQEHKLGEKVKPV